MRKENDPKEVYKNPPPLMDDSRNPYLNGDY